MVFIFYFYYYEKSATIETISRQLQETGSTTAQSIADWVNGRRLLMEHMADMVSTVDTADQTKTITEAPTLQKSFLFAYFGGTDGRMIMSPTGNLPADYDPRQRPWYKDALAAGRTTITEPYRDASLDELVVTLAKPVSNANGSRRGVVGADLSITELSDLVRMLDLGGQGQVFLVNRDGTILIHPDQDLALTPMAKAYPGLSMTVERSFREAEAEDGQQIVVFQAIKGLPSVDWSLAMVVDRDKAFATLTSFRLAAVVATVLTLVLVVVLLGLVVRSLVSRPIVALTGAMSSLAKGQLDITVPDTERTDEIGAMAKAVLVFRDQAMENQRLQETSSRLKAESEAQRQALLLRTAETFEHQVTGALEAARDASSNIIQKTTEVESRTGTSLDSNTGAATSAQHVDENMSVIASAVQELGASIREISAQAHKTQDICSEADSRAADAVGNVDDLVQSVTRISEIGTLIQNIASQTNLLALNATIEAARAGDAGKGFAVVANEVKTLATQTAHATEDIAQQVADVQGRTAKTSDAIRRISDVIKDITSVMSTVASAVEEQNAATTEIARAVDDAAHETRSLSNSVAEALKMTSQSRDAAREADSLAVSLREKFSDLTGAVDRFVVDIRDETRPSA